MSRPSLRHRLTHPPGPGRRRTPRGFLYFGPAPTIIAAVALLTGMALLFASSTWRNKPDLILVIFSASHLEGHQKAAADFQKATGKRVDIQLVEQRALFSRLQTILGSDVPAPDLVEVLEPNMGLFTRGPLSDVGFLDLTSRVIEGGWFDKVVPSRFTLWSSREHIFAIPHDVHPVMLAYRRDLVEAEGIDVNSLTTWDAFTRAGQALVEKHRRPDGNADRYMLDMPTGGAGLLQILLLQNDINTFDPQGRVAFDTPETVRVLAWYVRNAAGKTRIGFPAGWGQNLSQAFTDGLILFLPCPDWRTKQLATDMPQLAGKLALMPLPAWHEGGRRTSVWGGTGLAITKSCKNPDLAWQFATQLYYAPQYQAERFQANNILPPLQSSWALPELNAPDPFFSGQPRGKLYADLAPQTPPRYVNAFTGFADGKLQEVVVNSTSFYNSRPDADAKLETYIAGELARVAAQVRQQIDRNAFLKQPSN